MEKQIIFLQAVIAGKKPARRRMKFFPFVHIRSWIVGLAGLLLACSLRANPPTSSYRLVFADEFNGTSLDTTKWTNATPSWAMPASDAAATTSAVTEANGLLTITASRPSTTATFNSGSLTTYGKLTWTSGYFESRIQLPTTPGSWPAFWGLYTGWPPETDIMEYPITTNGGTDGLEDTQYNTNFHYLNSSGADAAGAGVVSTSENLGATGYHQFGCAWASGTSVTFYLDNSDVDSFTNSAVSQMVNMYMLLDFAVGGWPGTPSTTQWPAGWTDKMQVDWVRVWQINPNGDTTSDWNVAGSGVFATGTNWNNDIEPTYGNQTAYFGALGASTATITMPSWVVFGNITFDGSNGSSTAYTVGTSASQRIQLATTVSAGSIVEATSTCTTNQSISAQVEPWSSTTAENYMTGGQTLSFKGGLIGNGALSITGSAPTVLTAASPFYTGAVSIGLAAEPATLKVQATNALGIGGVGIGPAGNGTTALLQLTGSAAYGNSIDFRGRNNISPGIENVSGSNTLAGPILADVGGGTYEIQSDAGLLTLSGSLQGNGSTRTITLMGAGNGLASGAIQNGTATICLTKDGLGTWTLTGSNTYTGPTTVLNGALQITGVQPVADYTFDNVSGSTVVNTGTGGSSMNGTLTGSATVVSGGRYGNALSLSSSAYLNINSPIMSFGNTGNWTVSAWVQTTTPGATLLSKTTGGTSWASGNTIFYLGDGTAGGSGGVPSAVRYGGGFFQGASTDTAVDDGNWHMVTYVDYGGVYAIYVDGVQQSLSWGNSSFSNGDAGTVVRLGFTPEPGTSDGTVDYTGLLDEVQFYAQALSASQISALYHDQIPAGCIPAASSVAIGGTLQFNGVSQTLSSVSGTGSLVMAGPGTLTLAAANTFTGSTTLSSGTLVANGSLPAGGTLSTAANTLLTGTAPINATATINGLHQPSGSAAAEGFGTLSYGSTSRFEWDLFANSTATGFNQVAAGGPVTVASGAVVDVILNAAGSGVNLSGTFWTQSHTWPVVQGSSVSGGTFVLGNLTNDPSGHAVSSYGTLAVQQTSTAANVVFTPYTPFQNWQRQYFGSNSSNLSIAGPNSDPANDGVTNLMKFALGMNPNLSDAVPWTTGSAGLPVESVTNVGGVNYLSISVRCPIGLTGITYSASVSSDLANWSAAVQQGQPTSNGDGTETIVFSDTVPMTQGIQRFIQLVVTQTQ